MSVQYRWDDFVLDVDAYRLERAGIRLALEPKAFNLLALMIERPGHLFSKQEIFDAVWPGTAVTDHALTRVVAQLRRVLGDEAREARYLETVPTRGYRWIPAAVRVDASGSAGLPLARFAVPASGAPPATGRRFGSRLTRLVVAGVAAAVIVVAAGWFGLAQRRRSPAAVARASEPPWPVQLTTHKGLDMNPAWSPLGDAIAFSSERSGQFEIYVRTLGDAQADVPITADGDGNVQASWSPDGRWLAYHSTRAGGIWIVSSRGGPPRQIAAVGAQPAWSPDGRRIAFQSDEQWDLAPLGYLAPAGSTLWVIDVDGSHRSTLTTRGRPGGGHAAPAWSPDGRSIAFSVFDGGADDGLWVLDVATGKTTALVREDAVYESRFAPDGSAVYAAGGDAILWRVPFNQSTGAAAGRAEAVAVPGVTGLRGLALSPDGRQIAFAGVSLDSQIWLQPVAPDGSPAAAARALTSDTSRRNAVPAISPDGATVAYMSSRAGDRPNIWAMGIDGTRAVQLTADPATDYSPAWMSDGRRVLFGSRRSWGDGLLTVDASTRLEARLLDFATLVNPGVARPPGRFSEFAVSRSAAQAAFVMVPPSESSRRVYVLPLASPTARPLTAADVSAGYPSWSPDERSLAVQVRKDGATQAGVVDVTTGALRMLTAERGETWVKGWSPDGHRLVAAVFRDGVWSLRWIDVATGRSGTTMAPSPANVYVRYPDWSPHGGAVAFERGEVRGNIWEYPLPR